MNLDYNLLKAMGLLRETFETFGVSNDSTRVSRSDCLIQAAGLAGPNPARQ
jgi:hypothetical protein